MTEFQAQLNRIYLSFLRLERTINGPFVSTNVQIHTWWIYSRKTLHMESPLVIYSLFYKLVNRALCWRKPRCCEPMCGVWCLWVCAYVSHRVTHCAWVGRSKEQQTVVVTANDTQAGIHLVEVVCVLHFMCVSTCKCAVKLCTCCSKTLPCSQPSGSNQHHYTCTSSACAIVINLIRPDYNGKS